MSTYMFTYTYIYIYMYEYMYIYMYIKTNIQNAALTALEALWALMSSPMDGQPGGEQQNVSSPRPVIVHLGSQYVQRGGWTSL